MIRTYSNLNRNFSWSLFAVMLVYMLMTVLHLPEVFDFIYKGLILFVFISQWSNLVRKDKLDRNEIYLVLIFIAWLVIGFIRGVNYAEGYWVWKSVITQFFLSIFYIVILVSANTEVIKRFYRLYWKFFIPLVLLAFLYKGNPNLLDYVPFATLMLFIGVVPKNRRFLLFGIVAFYFIFLNQRNDLIKVMVMSISGIAISYFYSWIPKWSIRFIHITLLALPFILLWLGISGTFNVFKMDDYIKGDYTQEIKTNEGAVEDDLKADTRTALYQNVFFTMEKYDAWILGRSTAFGDEGTEGEWAEIFEDAGISGVTGRFGNEVGFLDILLWYGIIGIILYFMIYVRASYLAIYRSKSRFVVGLGLYVAFLWVWAFIWEKPAFETYFMMDLVLIGMCFSKQFREMTDRDIQIWVRGIFA